MREPTRREFLEGMAAGAALITLPGIWAGCARARVAHPGPGREAGFADFGMDAGRLRRTIARGLSRGGDFCDVYLQHKVAHWVGLEDGAVNRAFTTVDLGAGIRVLKGDATGYAYTEDLSEEALLAAAATAAAVADGPAHVTPKPLAAVPLASRYRVTVPWSEVGADRKVPLLQRADAQARAHDGRIIKVTAFLSDETSRILVADSDGRLVEDDQPMVSLMVNCVAERDGRTETSGFSASARDGIDFLSAATVDRVARDAARYTVILFDATTPPPGEYPVVLAPGLSGILLHEAIGHGMEADFNRKGISIYADRIGKRIAPDVVTIVDDGTNDRERGSLNVDDEGAGAERTVLVEKGFLRSYLHDRISAAHYGVAGTGSGRRESFRFPPVPRMRNTYMLPGPHGPEEVIGSVKKGLYAEMFTNGQVNIGAGDFTFYLKHGRLIEDGKLGRVVKDANLIGNGPSVLEKIDMVANDLALYSGAGWCGKDGQYVPVGFGLPTVRAGGISVGGRTS